MLRPTFADLKVAEVLRFYFLRVSAQPICENLRGEKMIGPVYADQYVADVR
tara:strand:- start:1542 stop:1694 length:153 start_codon:yes stop_codon:yes gene_type:complete